MHDSATAISFSQLFSARSGRAPIVFLALLLMLALGGCVTPRSGEPRLEAGFSPNGNALELILNAIDASQTSIQVAAYAFTSKPIAQALLKAKQRGVNVRVIADAKSSGNRYSAATFLANQGISVRTNGNYAIFHHKFMIFDARHVQTGSFNFSAAAANRNAENVLVMWNVPEIASVYDDEWRRLWDESAQLPANY